MWAYSGDETEALESCRSSSDREERGLELDVVVDCCPCYSASRSEKIAVWCMESCAPQGQWHECEVEVVLQEIEEV